MQSQNYPQQNTTLMSLGFEGVIRLPSNPQDVLILKVDICMYCLYIWALIRLQNLILMVN